MEFDKILLIGGSGFLGSHLAHLLAGRGCVVTVPTRRRERARHLTLMPTVEVIEADVHDGRQLAGLLAGQDAVINLVGLLHGDHGLPYGRDFLRAHVELPRNIAAACCASGVRRLLHVSALNADSNGPSQYLRSKGDGEQALLAQEDRLDLTIFQPSVIFGPGDSFLNLFARLLRLAWFIPLGRVGARFQPVFVEDVAAAMAEAMSRRDSFGRTYPLCGPKVYTLRELVEYVGRLSGHPRPIIELPEALARIQAGLLELLPAPPMSVDSLDSMDVDSVASGDPLPFGRVPTPLEAVAPAYLAPHTPRLRYNAYRLKARR
jgi:NADH dehydrogenase